MTTFRRQRRRARGFTLTELMVSLVMGLIVALAAIALARSATTSFHEEVRSSATEMSVRTASERLRQDLMRVSYMSTGNIVLDPRVAQLATAVDDAGAPSPIAVARYTSLQTLRGLRVAVGSAVDGGVTLPAGVNPDSIELVGNFTTDEAYSGVIRTTTGVSGCSTAQTIFLDYRADAAVFALAGGDGGSPPDTTSFLARAQNAFQPVAGQPFLAQVTDAMGCNHYVPVCAVTVDAGGILQVSVDTTGSSGTRAVLYAISEAGGGLARSCGASENGPVTIAPLTRVRWTLAASSVDPDSGIPTDLPKVDLVRQVLDFNGNPAGPAEVVAEHGVDLKFGIVVDDPDPALVGAAKQRLFDMDSDNGSGNIFNTTNGGPTGGTTVRGGRLGPQRVRSVRYRIAVRTSIGDRDIDIPSEAGALPRVCANVACTKYARVRTIVSEVTLHNQVGMAY